MTFPLLRCSLILHSLSGDRDIVNISCYVSWHFYITTWRKIFRKSRPTAIFPEISGKCPPEISELTTLVTDEKSERSHQRSQNQMDMRASLEKNAAPDVW